MNRSASLKTLEQDKQLEEQVINIDRVARVVKGGRRFRFRALVVVGDRKGRVGVGLSKGADVTIAISKATENAKKNITRINLKDTTIPHEAQAKVSGANVLIKPASKGTGLIAGGAVRTVMEVAGISDILSKSLGSSNKVNIAYACLEALRSLEPQESWIVNPKKKDDNKKPLGKKK